MPVIQSAERRHTTKGENRMKNSKMCPKCQSTDIIRVPGNATGTGAGNNIIVGSTLFLKFVLVTRYLCGSCGFSEEWIDTPEDIAKIRQQYPR
jgi:predicted nucleic-acid-binding Zn-ribbon protein